MSNNVLQVLNDAFPSLGGNQRDEARATGGEARFVTREEEVIRFLAENDGYAWQGAIGDALEWTKSKTSRTLSEMEADGRITRYQIGRRKVVCLPHREPACLGGESPARVQP